MSIELIRELLQSQNVTVLAAHQSEDMAELIAAVKENTQTANANAMRRLRFQKEVIDEICQLIKGDLQPSSTIRTALPIEIKVTVALSFNASGSFQASAGDICGIAQHAIHCSIHQVTEALYARRMHFINFPMTREAQTRRALVFSRIANFPNVQGAIDCTHIAQKVPLQNPEVFRNRKGFHSLNVQLIVDHNQIIMTPEGHGWMLRDKRYGLASWLMSPLRNPITEAEKRYNESHIAIRNIVKKAIGVLKQRFKCLDHSSGSLLYHPNQVPEFIVVCCMLHNLAIRRGHQMPDGSAALPPEGGEAEEPEGEEQEEEEAWEDNQPGDEAMVPQPPHKRPEIPRESYATAKLLCQQHINECFA
uniref:putative nuclease HARBI1 n=1 Tax=Pristiophorus japonicus TaxID=55135 RepID=UPI00398EC968